MVPQIHRTTVDLREFLPPVLAATFGDSRPGLPDEAAIYYLRRSAIKFAVESRVFRHTFGLALQPDCCVYPLPLDLPHEQVEALVSVKRNGRFYNGHVDEGFLHVGDTHGCAYEAYHSQGGCVEPVTVQVTVAVKPSHDACLVDALFMEHHDAVVAGALAEIHLMPQRPWTSGAASEARRKEHRRAAIDAKMRLFQQEAGTGSHKVQANRGYM